MAERKFKFVSPGVFIDEIDNSQLTKVRGDVGPIIIGRTERGPAMRPIKLGSFSEFVEIFGNPIPGGDSTDVFRDGNYLAPTYAGYAAQAWLKNNNAVTVLRLLGHQHSNTTLAGEAGWNTGVISAANATSSANGGAYGLFITDRDAGTGDHGVLAATLYATSGTYFTLSGTYSDGTSAVNAAATYVEDTGTPREWILHVRNDDSTPVYDQRYRINFTEDSSYYIRRVLNTNPTLTNTDITPNVNEELYWLGESYDGMVSRHVTGSTQWGFIAALELSGGTDNHADHKRGSTASRTGWTFPQDVTSDTGSYDPSTLPNLFRFIALENGEWEQQNLKISISDVKKSTSLDDPYGTFAVVLRLSTDSDNAARVVERFNGCSLNPNSNNYLAKKVGDTYSIWSDTERRLRWYGSYPNVSKYVRVQMDQSLDAGGGNAEWLPFGYIATPTYRHFCMEAGTAGSGSVTAVADCGTPIATMIKGSGSIPMGDDGTPGWPGSEDAEFSVSGATDMTYLFPAPLLRVSSSDGAPPNLRSCYWGVQTSKPGSSAFDKSYKDLVRMLSKDAYSDAGDISAAYVTASAFFSLDDLRPSDATLADADHTDFFWEAGSRADGTSLRGTNDYKGALLDRYLDRFTMDLHGGFDGLDITEKEPFRNSGFSSTAPLELNDYKYNTIKRAVDSVADPEVAEYNIMTMPGLTHVGLTSHMINVCEDRGDALAIIDLTSDYLPSTETDTDVEARRGSVAQAVTDLTARALNTSYACAYYPWVQIRDPQAGNYVWVPPSVVALGTLASSEKKSELWFAPAGFNRGGLTEGSAGLPVINVADRLNSDDRDALYAANINPIATFPAEGIVIFGQKTLQVTPSALDRINVRRLMIYVKKEISRMATRVLFDQNVQATWNRFLGMVKPFLLGIKLRFGLEAFKVVLDESTTTPDLIDRNIMYAKIFLKPTRAIEFIALDFTITNSGASFED